MVFKVTWRDGVLPCTLTKLLVAGIKCSVWKRQCVAPCVSISKNMYSCNIDWSIYQTVITSLCVIPNPNNLMCIHSCMDCIFRNDVFTCKQSNKCTSDPTEGDIDLMSTVAGPFSFALHLLQYWAVSIYKLQHLIIDRPLIIIRFKHTLHTILDLCT